MTHSLRDVLDSARWTEDQARAVLDALARSGQSVPQFAEQHAIQAQRLYLWRRKLGERCDGSAFLQVELHPSAQPHTPSSHPFHDARYEIVTAHGESLRIEGPLDASAVRTLLTLLREGAARAC